MCDLCFSSLEEISCLVVFGVYYVNFSAEPLKAVLFWWSLKHIGREHCNVTCLVSIALTQAFPLCTVWCIFHDGVIASGIEGKNYMFTATLVRSSHLFPCPYHSALESLFFFLQHSLKTLFETLYSLLTVINMSIPL